ncbi:glycosyltransferase family 2 protein [Synechococcus sp. 1G10]|uniref:glycosyltransferase family 2 protein n=1 Tax=Synechococcus sp. 1G10 TaxID=2025605 RepID=UPI000B97FB20|nr:glycosyltransferase [Synechococcus sp. 1G10]
MTTTNAEVSSAIKVSFVIPCLNEVLGLKSVLEDCHIGGQTSGLSYEIIVADNGSTDGSQLIAQQLGAQVIAVAVRGYGSALRAGIQASRGAFIMMGDADGTYCFREAPRFLQRLQHGDDLVIGNRFQGSIAHGAMPFLHRYLGNPVLSGLGRLFFGIRIGDFHCGLRCFRKEAIEQLGLSCLGMEFASEMVIKASLKRLRIAEVPTSLMPDHPRRSPHLRTWRDGWRHLRFMLSFSPRYAFLPLANIFLAISLGAVISFAADLKPFTGPNTLLIASFAFMTALVLASDYITTRILFEHFYVYRGSSRLSRFCNWLKTYAGTNMLFQLAGLLVLASAGMLLPFVMNAGISISSKLSNLFVFTSSCLTMISLSCYLTGAKLSTFMAISSSKNSLG